VSARLARAQLPEEPMASRRGHLPHESSASPLTRGVHLLLAPEGVRATTAWAEADHGLQIGEHRYELKVRLKFPVTRAHSPP
jgi:hypothetical protein